MIEQLRAGGRLIAPVMEEGIQNLVLLEKGERGVERNVISKVLYIPLKGRYGVSKV